MVVTSRVRAGPERRSPPRRRGAQHRLRRRADARTEAVDRRTWARRADGEKSSDHGARAATDVGPGQLGSRGARA